MSSLTRTIIRSINGEGGPGTSGGDWRSFEEGCLSFEVQQQKMASYRLKPVNLRRSFPRKTCMKETWKGERINELSRRNNFINSAYDN